MDILRPIITELTRQRIGVPRSVAEELDSLLKNTELKVSTNPCGYGSVQPFLMRIRIRNTNGTAFFILDKIN